jgi:creatinine amidohydrolase
MLDFSEYQSCLWQKQRREQIADAASTGAMVLLPIGAIEQHGPHLPLDTDSWTAWLISLEAAKEITEFQTLVLPPIWWGLSPYWMTFAGTLTLRPETFLAVVADICHSVAEHGFSKIVLVNGHGGNEGLSQAAAVKASVGGLRIAALTYWNLMPEAMTALVSADRGDAGHAGEMETSIQLAIQPECVVMEGLSRDDRLDLSQAVGPVQPGEGAAIYLPPNPQSESTSGVYGEPTAAIREKGEELLRAATSGLVDFLMRFQAS